MYKAKVKWNGNHYCAGDEVKGSKIEKREDGTTWLFDDEPIPECSFYGDRRDEWVEVDETTVVRLRDKKPKFETGLWKTRQGTKYMRNPPCTQCKKNQLVDNVSSYVTEELGLW